METNSLVTHDAGEPWSVCRSRTVIDHLVAGCARNPDVPILQFEDGLAVGRGQLLRLVAHLAGYLRNRVKPGDRVGVVLSNRTEYMVALLAVIANRAIVVSMNPQSKAHDAGHMLADAEPRLLIVEPENRELFSGLAAGLSHVEEVICVEGAEPDGFAHLKVEGAPFVLEDAECRREDLTCVFYTSGSTGAPKGCMVDHEWWLRIVDVDLRMNPEGRQRAMCAVPFFYADPALYMMELLQVGGTLVVMRRFSVSRYWQVVNRYDVTKVHAIASMPVLLLKSPPHPLERKHNVHHATCVAIPASMHRDLVTRFGFLWIENYGATETGQICRMPIRYHDEMLGSGSLGVPSPEVEFRVVSDSGEDVPLGEQGEAIMRAPGLFRGYYNRPDATAEALKDGWYYTGDLVRRDARGFVYFQGRKKDIVRRSGQNIAAAEVEAVLRDIPQVKDAAVIPVPDDIRGEEVKAYLLLVDGFTPADLPPEAVVEYCQARLSSYKVPRFIEYRTTDFARTPSTRVLKTALKKEKTDLRVGAWDRDAEMGRIRA